MAKRLTAQQRRDHAESIRNYSAIRREKLRSALVLVRDLHESLVYCARLDEQASDPRNTSVSYEEARQIKSAADNLAKTLGDYVWAWDAISWTDDLYFGKAD